MRFSLRALLLSTAFASIALGGWVAAWRIYYQPFGFGASHMPVSLFLDLSLWLPVPFAAYVAGRRRLSWQVVLAFALCQAVGVGIFALKVALIK